MSVQSDIEAVKVHLTQNMTQVLVLLMAEVDARLKIKSPVDTGRFRASWTIGLGQPDATTAPAAPVTGTGKTRKQGQVAVAEPRLPAIVMGETYYHANSLPYARRLEYGWSKQAPQGMVRITALEVPSIVEALTAQVGGT